MRIVPKPKLSARESGDSTRPSGRVSVIAQTCDTCGCGFDSKLHRLSMNRPTHNPHCLKDGKPCAADGNGGCQCCDDNKGGYNWEPVDIGSPVFDRSAE